MRVVKSLRTTGSLIGLMVASGLLHAQEGKTFPGRGEFNHYFSEAFIYRYTDRLGEYQFVWLCYNPDTRELLYVPNDDMLQAVISYPNGDYIGYLIDENDEKKTIRQHVPEVAAEPELSGNDFHRLLPCPQDTVLRFREYQQNERITASAIEITYLKTGECETVFVTEDFELNAYQIYGFSRLEGDMRVPFSLDYIGILTKGQLVTDVTNNPYQTVVFNSHTATVYHFDTAGYP